LLFRREKLPQAKRGNKTIEMKRLVLRRILGIHECCS